MTWSRPLVPIAAALALCAGVGCVRPGRIEPGLLTRYQKAVLERSPQPRVAGDGAGLLRPITDADRVPLKIVRKDGAEAVTVELTLAEAIRLALLNSLDVRVVSFQPAISREDMVQAAAAFDYVAFGSFQHVIQDEATVSALVSGESHVTEAELGVRKTTVTGAELSAAWELVRTSDANQFIALNRRHESVFTLSVTQPLLRNAWPDYNLAALRVARLGYRTSISEFRQQVEAVVSQVQGLYWALVRARRDCAIQEELLAKTIETRDRVRKRRKIDATRVEVKQAEAAVQTRRARLLRARKAIGDAQDELARVLADERLGLLRRYALVPTTAPVATRVRVDAGDQLLDALRFSPVMEQARLAIRTADINVRLAENETLPVLNFTAAVAYQGLRGNGEDAVAQMAGHDHISYVLGGTFEYPIGNRAARSALRQRKFERLQAIASMQNAADQLAVDVNEAVREIETAFAEVEANRAAVAAAKAELEALEDTEKIRGRLSPEFLQVKLGAQELLAAVAGEEVRALVDYNRALARLAEVTGTILHQQNIKLAVEAATEAPPRPRPAGAPE